MNRPLAYWSCGGEIFRGGGRAVTGADGLALLGLYQDEARAANAAGDGAARGQAARLARELAEAIDAASRWRRAAAPFDRPAQRGT